MVDSISAQDADSPREDAAGKVRTGEFFRESMLMYHRKYDDIIPERYLYLSITVISILMLLLTLVAVNMLFPLKTSVPFVYMAENIVDDLPVMREISRAGEEANAALRRFMLGDYVRMREEYDLASLDLNAMGVKSHSSPEVFSAYQASLDPENPQSPIYRFQRRATRKIRIMEVSGPYLNSGEARVVFQALIEDGLSLRKERGVANISFRFQDIEVDQTTGETSAFEFMVTSYDSAPEQ